MGVFRHTHGKKMTSDHGRLSETLVTYLKPGEGTLEGDYSHTPLQPGTKGVRMLILFPFQERK